MGVIGALFDTLRKMFVGNALLTLGAIAVAVCAALLLKAGWLPAPAAPFALAVAVIFVLVTAVNVSVFKTLRKAGK